MRTTGSFNVKVPVLAIILLVCVNLPGMSDGTPEAERLAAALGGGFHWAKASGAVVHVTTETLFVSQNVDVPPGVTLVVPAGKNLIMNDGFSLSLGEGSTLTIKGEVVVGSSGLSTKGDADFPSNINGNGKLHVVRGIASSHGSGLEPGVDAVNVPEPGLHVGGSVQTDDILPPGRLWGLNGGGVRFYHPVAFLGSVELPGGVSVGSGTKIDANVSIGNMVTIGANVIIGSNLTIGRAVYISTGANVERNLSDGSHVGSGVHLYLGGVDGHSQFEYARPY